MEKCTMLLGYKRKQSLLFFHRYLILFILCFILNLTIFSPALAQACLLQKKHHVNKELPKHESPCFFISRITLVGEGAKRFKFALKPVIKGDDPAIGHCLGVQGVNVVLARVQNAIVKKGYITTRVLLAPQNLKGGTLELTVVPGRVRDIRFAADTGSSRATTWNALPVRSGEILNLRDVEQGLENLKRVPTAEAKIEIEPARAQYAKAGESDLMIHYKQAFPLHLALSADDGGANETGKYQGAAMISYDNPFRLNDLFYLSLNHDLRGGGSSQYGTNGYNIYYSLPLHGWQLAGTSGKYHYQETVAASNQSYLYSGTYQNTQIDLSKVLYRDAVRKTTASLGGYLQNRHNFIEDTEIEVQHRRSGGWKPSVSHREWIGSATLDLNLAYRFGTRTFGSLPAPEGEFGEGTSFPNIFTGEMKLNLPFAIGSKNFRYNTLWRGQFSDETLIPQDRFSIGGRYSVRGFDGAHILSAERGWLTRNDLGLIWGNNTQELYFGADYGQVHGPSSDLLIGKQLAGTVSGLRGGYKGFSYDLFAGWPIDKPAGFKTASTTLGFNVAWSC